jgi:putative transposase
LFATLKKELVNHRTWPTRLEPQSAMFEYIKAFYNRERRHPTLNSSHPRPSSSSNSQLHDGVS